ncbi:dihydrofolate reductase family protein [Actinomadura terrae]|uniref:dihydrofolate reductase family protein n=1 Tax=Actinomadura terrae TaxID=604353 RepID=UPI001FA73198|nr:dihydrofolate reductase family protein [Actinomadura terrae]
MSGAGPARRVVLAMATSVDGFVSAEDGAVDWLFPYLDAEVEQWIMEYVGECDAQLIGRVNYLEQAAYWPTVADPQAPLLNDAEKVVFTSTLTEVNWGNARIAEHDVATEIELLRKRPGRDILVPGGVGFARHVVELGLVDLYRFMVYPVVLGAGVPLFTRRLPLRCVASRTFGNGSVALTYRPDESPPG